MAFENLVSAQDHDAISQLQFFARGVVEGLNVGHHKSPHKGSSVEFKEHRQYSRGDEIRSIDWKLFGKTDRLFIRQYEDETNLRASIVLDQSGSMAYTSQRRGALSKHDFSVRLAACLATFLIRQQDAVGLFTLDTDLRDVIQPRSNPGHLQAICNTLVASKPGGETSLATALGQVAQRIRRRGLLVLISDCFDKLDDLLTALRYFRNAGHDVVVFQIWDSDELNFPFNGRTQFRSLELSRQHIVDPRAFRQAYLDRVAEFRSRLENDLRKNRIDLMACTTDQNCGDVLADFIRRRKGGPQHHASATSSGSR